MHPRSIAGVFAIIVASSLLATCTIVIFEMEIRQAHDFCGKSDTVGGLTFYRESDGCYVSMLRVLEVAGPVFGRILGILLVSFAAAMLTSAERKPLR